MFCILVMTEQRTPTKFTPSLTNMYGSHSCYSHVPVLLYSYCMPFESSLLLYQCILLPTSTVATVELLNAIPILSLYQCTLLPICMVATVKLLCAIPILTVIISVHTVTNMYGSYSTVSVCHSNTHCHYTSAHCYQYVR